MKKNIFSLISIAILSFALFACSNNKEETYNLVGKIGKISITMSITIDSKGNANGTYYYNKYKKDIKLAGNLVKKGLILEEIVDGKTTAEFVGTFNKDRQEYKGNWINTKTEELIAFSFTQKKENTKAETKTSKPKDEPYLQKMAGTYGYGDSNNYEDAYISIVLTYINPTKMHIESEGWRNTHSGAFSFTLDYVNGQLVYTKERKYDSDYTTDDYTLTVYPVDDNTIGIEELNSWGMYGAAFGDFSGEYKRVKK